MSFLPPLPPHQDPVYNDDKTRVTIMEYITTIVAQLDRRFDTVHQELKESVIRRFEAVQRSQDEQDLRYQQRFDAQNKAVDAALTAQEAAIRAALTASDKLSEQQITAAKEAVTKQESANERRFDSVNEFRAQLSDQAATFMPRLEAEQRIAALSEKVDILRQAASAVAGRGAGLSAGWGYLVGAIGLAGALIGIVLALSR